MLSHLMNFFAQGADKFVNWAKKFKSCKGEKKLYTFLRSAHFWTKSSMLNFFSPEERMIRQICWQSFKLSESSNFSPFLDLSSFQKFQIIEICARANIGLLKSFAEIEKKICHFSSRFSGSI